MNPEAIDMRIAKRMAWKSLDSEKGMLNFHLKNNDELKVIKSLSVKGGEYDGIRTYNTTWKALVDDTFW